MSSENTDRFGLQRLHDPYPFLNNWGCSPLLPTAPIVEENPMSVLAKTNPQAVHDLAKRHLESEERRDVAQLVTRQYEKKMETIGLASAHHAANVGRWLETRREGERRATITTESAPLADSFIRRLFVGEKTDFSLTTTMEID
jgi:hypothetical protein